MVNTCYPLRSENPIHALISQYAAGDVLLPSLDIDSSEHIPSRIIFDGNLF
jgi:hypothetical protein